MESHKKTETTADTLRVYQKTGWELGQKQKRKGRNILVNISLRFLNLTLTRGRLHKRKRISYSEDTISAIQDIPSSLLSCQ